MKQFEPLLPLIDAWRWELRRPDRAHYCIDPSEALAAKIREGQL